MNKNQIKRERENQAEIATLKKVKIDRKKVKKEIKKY